MVWNSRRVPAPNIPKRTYGDRLFVCPYCNRKQSLKPDDQRGSIIKCTVCYKDLLVKKNLEVEDSLYECQVEKAQCVHELGLTMTTGHALGAIYLTLPDL